MHSGFGRLPSYFTFTVLDASLEIELGSSLDSTLNLIVVVYFGYYPYPVPNIDFSKLGPLSFTKPPELVGNGPNEELGRDGGGGNATPLSYWLENGRIRVDPDPYYPNYGGGG